MSILSKQAIAASIADFSVKKLLDDFTTVATVAAAGSLISDGTPLQYGRNIVTDANATKAVVLPDAKLNSAVEVVNTVANAALIVFPKLAGDQINAITAGEAFTQAAGSRAEYYCDAAGHWCVAAANLTGTATAASQAELDVLSGALATNLVAAKAAITTTGGALTLGGSVTAVGSFIIGSADLNEADMEKLDGITNGQVDVAKAIVPTTDKHIDTIAISDGGLKLGAGAGTAINATAAEINDAADRSTQVMAAGGGITAGTGTLHYSSIQKIGDWIKTTIFMDLTGLASSTTDLDIIGDNGTATTSHIGQITAAKNGTIFMGTVTWLETPAGGIDDIIFYEAVENTGTFDGGIAALTETELYNKGSGAAAAINTKIALTALPTADKYLYLVNGAGGTAADYTAGQFVLELWGA